MEKSIPSAKEFISEFTSLEDLKLQQTIVLAMIEFAKLHVEVCKQEISKKDLIIRTPMEYPHRVVNTSKCQVEVEGTGVVRFEIDIEKILNSYPLENIK